jgi:hypothetical protein
MVWCLKLFAVILMGTNCPSMAVGALHHVPLISNRNMNKCVAYAGMTSSRVLLLWHNHHALLSSCGVYICCWLPTAVWYLQPCLHVLILPYLLFYMHCFVWLLSVQVNARPLFMAAAQAGLSEYVMQLCGQGYPLCREGSTAELMQRLVQEAESCVQHLTKGD